jgi:hypothetical protein
MRRAALVFALVAIGVACSRPSSVQPAPDPSSKPLPPPKTKPTTASLPDDVVRTHGDIEGKISLRSRTVVVGEPIVAMVEARSTKGPLKVFVGGDQRNSAGYPTRLALRALDAQGGVVCDSVDAPALPNFGGIGAEQTVPQTETWTEGAVLNPMCPGLAKPGKYSLNLHRRIAHDGMLTTKPGSAVPLSCDFYPVHEGPMPKGWEPACSAQMDALPWITTETTVVVEPFDAARLRVATEARLHEAAPPTAPPAWVGADSEARWRIDIYVCEWLACGCPKVTGGDGHSDAQLLSALPSSLPKSFPDLCPASGP